MCGPQVMKYPVSALKSGTREFKEDFFAKLTANQLQKLDTVWQLPNFHFFNSVN